MGIAVSVVLIALGSTLVWSVRGGGLTAVGVALLILGGIVAVLSLVHWSLRVGSSVRRDRTGVPGRGRRPPPRETVSR